MAAPGFFDVRKALAEGDLGARDRLEAGLAGRTRELHRAVEAVVVREREGGVAELHGPQHQLFGMGGTVQEGKARMAVQLDVRNRHTVSPALARGVQNRR